MKLKILFQNSILKQLLLIFNGNALMKGCTTQPFKKHDLQQLFLNDNDNDAQTELQFADLNDFDANGGEGQCASSNLAGKFRRRSECGIIRTVTEGPAETVRDVTLLDRLYCLTASIFIKSLFVCSSPDPSKTIPGPLIFWTLYESTRCTQNFSFLSLLFSFFFVGPLSHPKLHNKTKFGNNFKNQSKIKKNFNFYFSAKYSS